MGPNSRNTNMTQFFNTNNDLNNSEFTIQNKQLSNAPLQNNNNNNEINIYNNSNNNSGNNNIPDVFRREQELTQKNNMLNNQINLTINKSQYNNLYIIVRIFT